MEKLKNGNGMHLFRSFLAGFGFVLFGAVGLLGNLIFIPIVLLRLNKYAKVQYFSRNLVRWSWYLYIQNLRMFNLISYSISLSVSNEQKQIIIANHPSLLDVVFLLAHISGANCVIKSDLSRNIFLRYAISASGYIYNTTAEALLEKSLLALERGENLIIFPEGTRTSQEIIFHKAVSYLAIHGAKSLKMIYIHSLQKALKKEQSWYNIPQYPLGYEIFELGEKRLEDFMKDKPNPIRIKALHKFLNDQYQSKQKEFYATQNLGR